LNTLASLENVMPTDAPHVGTKAAALGELCRAGFNVPNGFVLTDAAYSQLIAPLRAQINQRVTSEVVMDPSEIEAAASEVREWIEQAPWSPDLHAALQTALSHFSDANSFAARTSVPSDDLATAIGSGVERAYLGLVGAASIEQAAARCWGALWNSRAMYYRHRKKISQTDVALAVLVQPMIHADAAGVMFTQNPMTGERSELQVDSIWGLGAPLTSARVKPDRFYFSKTKNENLAREIEEKTVRLVVGENGETEQQAVPSGQINAPSLSDEQVMTLAALGAQIENFFGEPQDIEWARVGDDFYILQARPIALRTT
jgi:pyruvate,water dikinase